MEAENFDAIMVTGDLSAAMNYRYFSGHLPRDYQSNFSRPHVMILPREGKPALIAYVLNEQDAKITSWVRNIRAYTQPFTFRPVYDAIKELGLDGSTIGAELGVDQRLMMPVLEFQRLQESLPRAKFVDAAELLWEMRTIKSPREVECIKRADEMNGASLDRLYQIIHKGMTEIEVAKKLVTLMIEEGSWRPPHDQIIMNSGPDWRVSFMAPKEKVITTGDILFIDSGCVVKGYWGEFNRMGVVGKPTERQLKNHEIIRTIVQKTIADAVRPGVKMSDLTKYLVKMYKSYGLDYEVYKSYLEYPYMHLSHGIGLNSSEPPFVRIDNDKPLKPGMTLSMEAYLKDSEVYGTEEDVLITDDGYEILSEKFLDNKLYLIRETSAHS